MIKMQAGQVLFLFIVLTLTNTMVSQKISSFSAKADIDIIQSDSKESFTAHFRYKPMDTLWISLTGTLGIEGARILVTRDSTYYIDKLSKMAYRNANNEVSPFLPMSLDMNDWNLLLLSESFPMDSSTLVQMGDIESRTYYFPDATKVIRIQNKMVQQAEVNAAGQTFKIQFSQYEKAKDGIQIALHRVLDIAQNSENCQVNIHIQKYKLDQPLQFPFDLAKYSHAEPQ